MKSSEPIRQPNDISGKIWRYMDLPKFIYLLDKRRLYLARADKFEDTHEGVTPGVQKDFDLKNDPKNAEILGIMRSRQPQWTFISCWSHCEDESHALWRIFCGPK